MTRRGDMIAIYSRKSKFTGKGESIGNQVELCRAYASGVFGETAQCVVFEDEGFSGGNLNRPAFQNMMAEIRKRKFSAIIVYRLDRISRNISDFTGLIEELTRLGVSFISIREQFDTGTPMGRAMMFIISVFSQLERETIAERIRDNMRELAKTGRWLGGTVPIGFRSEAVNRITIDGKVKQSFQLVSIPEEAEIPRLIFDLYLQTDSLSAVETELLQQHIKTRQGKTFTRFAIKAILQNPVYMVADADAYNYFIEHGAEVCFPKEQFDGQHGIIAYHRTDQRTGRATVLLPVNEWIIALGSHPGLIPSTTWICVQESLERNKSKAYRKPRRNEALLTGILYCSCGSRMYPKLSSRKTTDGVSVFSYVCKIKERSKGKCCRQRNINGNQLDAAVLDQIKLLSGEEHRVIAKLEKSRRFFFDSREEMTKQIGKLETQYKENERRITGLIDSVGLAEESEAKSRLLNRIEELSKVNQEMKQEIQKLEQNGAEHKLSDVEFEILRQTLSVFSEIVDGMTVAEKRSAVRALIQRVTWDGVNAHTVLCGAEDGLEIIKKVSR